jgi:hypothetical protein
VTLERRCGSQLSEESPTLIKFRGRHPDIQLFCHAQQTANIIFRDCHPDVPPLALEPQRRTNQPPATRAAQGKLLADHGRCTKIRGRRPGLKVRPPPLRRIDRADNLVAPATQDCHPSHVNRTMKHMPAMGPEAAASTHNHHPGQLPRRPPTPTKEKVCTN